MTTFAAPPRWFCRHRRRRRPFEKPGLDQERLDDLMAEGRSGQRRSSRFGRSEPDAPAAEPDEGPTTKRTARASRPARRSSTRAQPGRPGRSRWSRRPACRKPTAGSAARPARVVARYTRAVADPAPRHLAVDATLRSAARNGLDDRWQADRPAVRPPSQRANRPGGNIGSLHRRCLGLDGGSAAAWRPSKEPSSACCATPTNAGTASA